MASTEVAPAATATAATARRHLIALDFDDTIAGRNTDLVASELLLPGSLTAEHRRLHSQTGWLDYMQAVFGLLHQQGHRAAGIGAAVAAIPEVAGMRQCIRRLVHECDFDAIIISDSNAVFIGQWNRANGLAADIKEVFTNPAEFDATGVLRVHPHHQQSDCTLSSHNLCKGRVLQEFLANRLAADGSEYARIFYVGDGRNDVCPALRLPRTTDVACARSGWRLEAELRRPPIAGEMRAEVVSWTDGHELLRLIEGKLVAE